MTSNAANASGLSGASTPPASAASTLPSRMRWNASTDGDSPGGARIRDGQDRTLQAEGDPDAGRRRAAEQSTCEVR